MSKVFNWLTCKSRLFKAKIIFLFLIFLCLYYFMDQGLIVFLILYTGLTYRVKSYAPKGV